MYIIFMSCFQGNVKSLKICAIERILLKNNMLKVKNTRREISPSLTIKIKSLA